MTNEMMKQTQEASAVAALENVLIGGDLAQLNERDRLTYYKKVCESVGLNALTKPFQYLRLSGRLVLYATKDATDQLRKLHHISIRITGREQVGDVWIVTAEATDKDGRVDCSTGAVSIGNLRGDTLANALMKAETKAKRRVTLSISGLGMLDETETETISGAVPVDVKVVPAEADEESAVIGIPFGGGSAEISELRDILARLTPTPDDRMWLSGYLMRRFNLKNVSKLGVTELKTAIEAASARQDTGEGMAGEG